VIGYKHFTMLAKASREAYGNYNLSYIGAVKYKRYSKMGVYT